MYTRPAGYSGFGANATLTNGWHIVGCSRRSGPGASSLYVDGVQIGTGTVAAPPGGSATEIGRKDGGSAFTDAGICGVAVFPTALTTAQHLALAQAAGLA